MHCEEALVLISGYLDETITEEEMAQLRIHLEACPACRQLLEDFRAVDRGIASLEAQPPADLKQNVMEAIRAEAKPVRKRQRWAPVAVAAALVLVIGVSQANQIRQSKLAAAPAAMAEMAAPAVYSRAVSDTPAYDSEDGFFVPPTNILDSQQLADDLGGSIAETRELLPEMEVSSCETLEDGTLLYHLDGADAAELLSKKYGLEVYRTHAEPVGEVSYARLIP